MLGRITTTAYSADGLTTTVTSPAGATSITTRNTDGSTASVGGTAQRAQVFVYDLNGSNTRTTTKLADGTTIAQSISNGFGQTTVQAQASTTGFIYTRSEYNAKGQLVKQTLALPILPLRIIHLWWKWLIVWNLPRMGCTASPFYYTRKGYKCE